MVMALNWAQQRYFVNLTGEREGVLQIRLTPEEGLALAALLRTDDPLNRGRFSKRVKKLRESKKEDLALLWQDIRDACLLFELPEGCLSQLAIFSADAADRPSYTRLPDVEVGEGPLVAFLLGGAARSGSASFGPGYGASGDLEAATSAAKALLSDRATAMKERLDTWPRLAPFGSYCARSGRSDSEQSGPAAFAVGSARVAGHELVMKGLCARERQVGLGLGECIASGLRKMDGPQAEDAVLERLEATLKQLKRYPERWPSEVQETLPTLEELQKGRKLSARSWQAMAASGPWPDTAKEEAQKTVAEAEAAAYDFGSLAPKRRNSFYYVLMKGGETDEGLQAAKSLEAQASSGSAECMLQLGEP
eukprot:s586_g8.t1